MISIARGNRVNTKPIHEVIQARREYVISRAGDGVREGCDHRDEQEEKRSEGGTGRGRRPAPTVTGKVPFTGSNAFLIMNDWLLNSPVPPRELDPDISPQLQEIIYRALERDPNNRYPSAREICWDLEQLDQVGVSERPELHDWKRRRTPWLRRVVFYAMVALIPVVILTVLLYVARKS